MKLTIDSNTPINDMTQDQSQKIKRVANVLRDAGFDVEIIWRETLEASEDGTTKCTSCGKELPLSRLHSIHNKGTVERYCKECDI